MLLIEVTIRLCKHDHDNLTFYVLCCNHMQHGCMYVHMVVTALVFCMDHVP